MAGALIIIMLHALTSDAYPVSYTSCGVEHTVSTGPQRAVTMNQGATEFMLALGLADRMAGTAYLDDYIWPQYATDYAKIPVLASAYPNESTIMSVSPDFIVGSYMSAFYEMYNDTSRNRIRGIFNTTVAECKGAGSEWEDLEGKHTCRPQLHSKGIGTYLMADACEDKSLRPDAVSEETVYEEMRALGSIFKVNVEPLVKDMREDFDSASGMVSSANHGEPLNAAWIDCVGRCCKVDEGEEPEIFVGAGQGVPNLLLQKAGLNNVFKNEDGNWACVKESALMAASLDVIVVVDAAWDTAVSKLQWLYNKQELCDMDVMKGARFVHIPFSATTLSPRNGPAALDLAIAAIHVRLGSLTAQRESGVSSFNPNELEKHTEGLPCSMQKEMVMYSDAEKAGDEVNQAHKAALGWPLVFAIVGLCAFTSRPVLTTQGVFL